MEVCQRLLGGILIHKVSLVDVLDVDVRSHWTQRLVAALNLVDLHAVIDVAVGQLVVAYVVSVHVVQMYLVGVIYMAQTALNLGELGVYLHLIHVLV